MVTAKAESLKKVVSLKAGEGKAKDFQKLRVLDWLDANVKSVPLSDNP